MLDDQRPDSASDGDNKAKCCGFMTSFRLPRGTCSGIAQMDQPEVGENSDSLTSGPIRSHDRRRLRSSASAAAARRLAGIATRRASTAWFSRKSTFGTSSRKRTCQRAAARSSARRGYGSGNAAYHLETAIARVDDRLAERIEGAEAPFWTHVRHALAELGVRNVNPADR